MNYVLVQNKQTILLGPIDWRYRFIQSELDDLEVDYTASPTEPNGYLKINDELEIYPVTLEMPSYDGMYQHLSGPHWEFIDEKALGEYVVLDRDIQFIKNDLKELASNERYKKQNAGTSLTLQDTEIFVDTSVDERNVFVHKILTMTDEETAHWKFSNVWLNVTKLELNTVLTTITNFVQEQFVWEKNIVDQIESSQTIDELKSIRIL
jgi:hypothetical protein